MLTSIRLSVAICRLSDAGMTVHTGSVSVLADRDNPPMIEVPATELPPIHMGRDRNGTGFDVRFPVKRDRSRRHVSLRDHRGGRHAN